MKFDYSPLPSLKNKSVLAPVVPVTFSYKGKEFPTFALVDSGAAGASISTVVAEDLGIAWQNLPETRGFSVSGSFRAHIAKNIEATIEDGNESYSFTLDITIIEGISPYHCILGQRDLFQKAKVIFESYSNNLELVFREMN